MKAAFATLAMIMLFAGSASAGGPYNQQLVENANFQTNTIDYWTLEANATTYFSMQTYNNYPSPNDYWPYLAQGAPGGSNTTRLSQTVYLLDTLTAADAKVSLSYNMVCSSPYNGNAYAAIRVLYRNASNSVLAESRVICANASSSPSVGWPVVERETWGGWAGTDFYLKDEFQRPELAGVSKNDVENIKIVVEAHVYTSSALAAGANPAIINVDDLWIISQTPGWTPPPPPPLPYREAKKTPISIN